MHFLRTTLVRHRTLAALMLAAALCLKAVLPTGYMVGQQSKVLTVQLCDASSGHAAIRQIAIPMTDGTGQEKGQKTQGDCAYGSLSMVSATGPDPALLLLAVAFILALGFAPVRIPASKRISHVRPPLRGPPALS
jgi:hypothetical protein